MVIGCGSANGWDLWRVMKRSKANKKMPHNPKDDMGTDLGSLIEIFDFLTVDIPQCGNLAIFLPL